MAAKKSYEEDVDLAKSFKEIIIEGPRNELEFGIVKFVGRHFSDQAIENALNSDLTIGEVLGEADKEIESSEKKLDEKLQKQTRSAVGEIARAAAPNPAGRRKRGAPGSYYRKGAKYC
ncbi:MAG: Prohead core protein [Candidatus Midichloria mitochondrii]|uniref:Uncharacterized protein n=1 Tax=Midichloria mitochondrii (strain IricVA) TaxID=696127 RepID=F7XU72_MIDMI|nr:hypothetical protein [Candidatus Midichloria mitochondrii]AEI89431.1 hypothetical protein midi_01155 [Candidatus Midichloria mitochondrii IricVA]MDJ1256459.1 hypothetical protein [Candidatus Midichloria mitochondrii]MDJ1288163.1 hypothetical protein [Candidatus Midichloria mitochondrii]MDJ1299047.1 hypothetical protein [Candidatus Midichloria mitochondrii]MDJ1313217.1 hypothetical protein [Candidatus Midichloria mitochondrii]